MVSEEYYKTNLGEQFGYSDEEIEITSKPVQVCTKHEIEQGEKCGGSDAEMKGSNKAVEVCIKDETECRENVVERRESRKGMGMVSM